jgi:MFS family permease
MTNPGNRAAARRGHTGALVTLTAAQAAGQAGTWAGYVAALPAALVQPHPAVALSAITAAWGIPSAAARLAGGVVDRHGPRITGATSWAIAALAAAVPAVAHLGMPELLAVLAVLSVGGTWGVSAGEAAPTWLPGRPDLAAAGSWLVVAGSIPLAIGPVGATNLVTYAGDRAAWAMVAVLSAAAAICTLMVPAVQPEPPAVHDRGPKTRIPRSVWAVFAVTAGIYVTFGVITILEPLYVRQVLHGPFTVYGWLLAVWAVAGILTSVVVGRWPKIATWRWAVPLAAAVVAVGEAVYVSTPWLKAAFAGAAMFGIGSALFRLSARAVIVRAIPRSAHGRALSLWESVQCAFFVAPSAATGALVTMLGLRLVLGGCCTLAGGVAGITLRARQASIRASRPQPGIRWQTRADSPPPVIRQPPSFGQPEQVQVRSNGRVRRQRREGDKNDY